ncbi:ribonuclease R [Ichthyobacterium seriolicida]|uniref:Ribonuclease R n=1 Tax=Ichthyobacterium seriolicida TaxID=242600 RepID=A0A1J1E0B3_9FLAO|nr:ribonuclease R [Ichthyobacterium seriolicida]BAV94373.1 ribonuclease R [Ichthyobacterium seriolicida]
MLKRIIKSVFYKKEIMRSKKKHTDNLLGKYITGRVDMTSTGSCYIVSQDTVKDVFVSEKHNALKAFNNDEVKVYIHKVNKQGRLEGKITDIVNRNKTSFVGTIRIKDKSAWVVLSEKKILTDISIPLDKTDKAKDKDKVVVNITNWAIGSKKIQGEVTRVLGASGENKVEINCILEEYELPYEFPEEVERQANAINDKILNKEVSKRRDMRSVDTFTIDPVDAKDFDDAISVEEIDKGIWEVGVHIADVSHYVKPNTLLDKEAYKRGTSVYLVDKVVPMLPEILSNKVCSLRPDEEKYTFSVIFQIDENANVKNQWFGRTVINSNRRFTYEEAQEVIETGKGDFNKEILYLNKVAKIMREKRISKGSISFDKGEAKFNLDREGFPTSVYLKECKESNHLVEEFMLLANKSVSTFINKDNKNHKKTFVYRVHDEPDSIKIEELSRIVKKFGYSIDIKSKKKLNASLNKLLSDIKGKAEANMIETLVMRSMSKAKYSTENIGHYGLSFNYYSHFTSPIRRYPDIMAHRLLQHYLDKGSSVSPKEYEDMCQHCSAREILAYKAEKDTIKFMQVLYMHKFTGKRFKGIITGVTDWGIYVQMKDNHCEGLVRIDSIKPGRFRLDSENYRIVGVNNDRVYQLGDEVEVLVTKTNLSKRHITLELV